MAPWPITPQCGPHTAGDAHEDCIPVRLTPHGSGPLSHEDVAVRPPAPPPPRLCLKGGGHPPPLPTLFLQLYPKARPQPQYPPPRFSNRQ